MLSHTKRTTALAFLLVFSLGSSLRAQTPPPEPQANFRQLLQNIAEFSPDPCGPPYGKELDWHVAANIEFYLFSRASDEVVLGLNANSASQSSPRDRAAGALRKLEQMSTEINSAWPEKNRFHFQILDLSSALVVKMGIRTTEGFSVFGIAEHDLGNPTSSWREVGSNSESSEFAGPPSEFDLYPLHRGPSGNARFLAKGILSGCAGSIGVAYDAREWDPHGMGSLEQIIKQTGSFGLDDKVPGFPQVGELRTEGPLVTLPYCWFSAIDTWDNPSLCAADTYDLSGDRVKFKSRVYSRPDLVPIAKSIEYAEHRDYPAVRGYCASDNVAQKLVREITPDVFADDLRVLRINAEKEVVKLGDSTAYRFEVEKQNGEWRVTAFETK
jgi:hypothetical protein